MSDLPESYFQIIESLNNYEKALSFFWSETPLSHTHERLLSGKNDLIKLTHELIKVK